MTHRYVSLFSILAALVLAGCSRSAGTPTATAAPAAARTAAATEGDREAGKKVYLRVCFVCHQPTGVGVPGAFPPLAGSEIATAGDPAKIIRLVLFGLQGPIEVRGTTFNSVMPAHAPQLNDREIADVLTYVRSAWGNDAKPVTVEAVAAARQLQRPAPWTWAELNAP